VSVRDIVFEAMNNEVVNGYNMFKLSDEAQARDLMTYYSEIEEADQAEVEAAVHEWRMPL